MHVPSSPRSGGSSQDSIATTQHRCGCLYSSLSDKRINSTKKVLCSYATITLESCSELRTELTMVWIIHPCKPSLVGRPRAYLWRITCGLDPSTLASMKPTLMQVLVQAIVFALASVDHGLTYHGTQLVPGN